MNRKIIWIIIGLMSVAVIGVMSLQLNFITQSIRLNESQFDGQIRDALKRVANRVESIEEIQVAKFANGYSIQSLERDSAGLNAKTGNSTRWDEARIKQTVLETPIEERINLVQLDGFLKQELAERGINTYFNYGVFANAAKSFVVVNNHFVVPDENQMAFEFLQKSNYKTNLFLDYEGNSPGTLFIHFPSRTGIVWGNMWQILLLSVLFVLIILSCFGFTINVILQQKKLSEMKTDFINNMTHEFKTPIATISLASDSITNPNIISNPEKVKRFIDIIKQENKRMNGQVEKVLQMALIERDHVKLNLSDVNLHEVITQAIGNISLQVEKKDGTARAQLDAQNCVVEGDSNHISNIINNLLDNANKYSPETPEISISTRNVSNGVEVTVSDNGIGMNKEDKKRIFEKFFRIHTGNLHDVKGFGLGLSYVRTMMTAHKGTIEVKSELHKGSSFILFFPFKVIPIRDI
jgi:two-component system, OmpR family, phosphate regulon sensor histidine kinase PhoR